MLLLWLQESYHVHSIQKKISIKLTRKTWGVWRDFPAFASWVARASDSMPRSIFSIHQSINPYTRARRSGAKTKEKRVRPPFQRLFLLFFFYSSCCIGFMWVIWAERNSKSNRWKFMHCLWKFEDNYYRIIQWFWFEASCKLGKKHLKKKHF